MSREKVSDEIAAELIEHIRELIAYWENTDKTSLEKLNGLAFSILATLDGSSDLTTGFIIAPSPHPEDKEFNVENGTNYYPSNEHIVELVNGDIGGYLHELFVSVKSIDPILKKVEKRHYDRMKKLHQETE